MIKTLRKRFIRIAMLAVTAVLLALCLIVNAANYISVDNSLTNMLQIISNNRGMVPQSPPGGFDKPGTRPEGGFTPVHNTGEPIPPEHLPHLFERFYRTDSDRARSQGGYGLGLSIAKSIVDGHRGRISVSSSAISGTLFTVRLPLPGRGLGHLRTRSLG